MKKTFGILAIVACAGVASASTSFTPAPTIVDTVTFNNIASIDAQGDTDNILGTWGNTGSGTVNQIRVTGQLTEVATATFGSEAQVRISSGVGNSFSAFNVQGSTTTSFTGSLSVNRTVSVTPFTLNAAEVRFEWFESAQDGPAGVAEAIWDTVTYEFIQSGGPTVITNGNFALGTLNPGASISTAGSHVAGGLDFFTFTISDDVNGGGYLNIRMLGGATGGMTDTEIALYDAGGSLVSADDDGSGSVGFFSMMSFGAADPNVVSGDDAAGSDGLFLPAGTYTLVTAGFNTNFTPDINNIVAGTNAGTYGLSINYVPTPGALALLGMGGLIANRRRR